MVVRTVIPCWPIVAHFLNKEFGDPIKLNTAHPLCKTLTILLESKKGLHYRDSEVALNYESQVILVLNKKMRQISGHHLSKTRIQQINTIVKKYFYDRMFDYLDMQMFHYQDFNISQGILDYLLQKEIPLDTIQVETILKAYRRHRRKSPTAYIKTNWKRTNPNPPNSTRLKNTG